MTQAKMGFRTTHVFSWRDYQWFVTRREKCPEITPGSALFKVVDPTEARDTDICLETYVLRHMSGSSDFLRSNPKADTGRDSP